LDRNAVKGAWRSENQKGNPMTLSVLYIGGTGQISLPCVEASVAAGHKVTVLNRGKTSVPLPKGVATLVGDMNAAAYGDLGDPHSMLSRSSASTPPSR
jgi:hypothetical protein